MYFHFLFCFVSSFASSSFYNVFIRYIPDATYAPEAHFPLRLAVCFCACV